MNARSLAWFVMTLLAIGVAAYAASVALLPAFRPPIVLSLIERLPVTALVHFCGGAIALAVGALQFNSKVRTRAPAIHRWLGRVYVLSIIASGSAGLMLALSSTGGPWARWGFALLAIGWLATTLNAYRLIRRREVMAHREWMIRSYALTLAAVTLRFYLPLAQGLSWPMSIAYPAIAWLCWIPNVIAAEWLIRSGFRRQMPLAAPSH